MVTAAGQPAEPEPEPESAPGQEQIVLCVGEIDDLSQRIITAHQGGMVRLISDVPCIYVVMLPPGTRVGDLPRPRPIPSSSRPASALPLRLLIFPSDAALVLCHQINVTDAWIRALTEDQEQEQGQG